MITNVLKYFPDLGFAARLYVYLKEMYPILPRLLTASFMYFGFTLFLGKLAGISIDPFNVYSITGIGGLFTIALILRLMDELKDRQTDAILFRDRPLPSGRVKENDIKFMLIVSSVAFVCFYLYSKETMLSSLIVLSYTFLMFRYFFFPKRMHDYLLLNLITHNPVTVIILLHLTVIFAAQYNLNLSGFNWSLLSLVMIKFWCLFLAWEISRKIRYVSEETEYITYSSIFGQISAALISYFIQTISFAISIYLYYALSLSLVYLIIISLAYKILIVGYFRFLFKKMSAGIKLRSVSEFFAMATMLAIILESILKGWM